MPESLAAQQALLAAHIRDAAAPLPPGVEPRRMAVYRELFYNALEGLLAGGFPVLKRSLGEERWHALVRRAHATHAWRTPYFTRIGEEFVGWLQSQPGLQPGWIADLAHYEWAELGLQLLEAPLPPHDRQGDPGSSPGQALLDGIPVRSPLAWAFAYTWPVHRISPDFQPQAAPSEPTCLLLRREADGRVHFSQLSPLALRLLELIDEHPRTAGHDILALLAAEAGVPFDAEFLQHGGAMLRRMHDEGVLLGPRCGSASLSR